MQIQNDPSNLAGDEIKNQTHLFEICPIEFLGFLFTNLKSLFKIKKKGPQISNR